MKDLTERLRAVKLVVADCDGTLTDAGIYYGPQGEELLRFSRRDGMGFDLLRQAGLRTGIMTRENSEIVRRRAEKLKIEELHLGVLDKAVALREVGERLGLKREEIAFIGDDLNDLPAFRSAGLRACPSDATTEVKAVSDLVLTRPGGHGAFRELADQILQAKGFRSVYLDTFANSEEE